VRGYVTAAFDSGVAIFPRSDRLNQRLVLRAGFGVPELVGGVLIASALPKSTGSSANCNAHLEVMRLFNAQLCVSFTKCGRRCKERVLMQMNAKGKSSAHDNSNTHTHTLALIYTYVAPLNKYHISPLNGLTNGQCLEVLFRSSNGNLEIRDGCRWRERCRLEASLCFME
jgi:hypothetical protein